MCSACLMHIKTEEANMLYLSTLENAKGSTSDIALVWSLATGSAFEFPPTVNARVQNIVKFQLFVETSVRHTFLGYFKTS